MAANFGIQRFGNARAASPARRAPPKKRNTKLPAPPISKSGAAPKK